MERNAASDLPDGFKAERVVITVEAKWTTDFHGWASLTLALFGLALRASV